MSKASKFLNMASGLAVSTIIQGLSSIPTVVAHHVLPDSYDDSDNRNKFNEWVSFTLLSLASLGSELLVLAKLKKNHLEPEFTSFVRSHIVPTLGSVVPAVTTTLALYSIGGEYDIDSDAALLVGAVTLLVNSTLTDASILKRAFSSIIAARRPLNTIQDSHHDTDSELFEVKSTNRQKEKVVAGLIIGGWALAIGSGFVVKYAAKDDHILDQIALPTAISLGNKFLIFPVGSKRRSVGAEFTPLLDSNLQLDRGTGSETPALRR